MKSCVIKKFAVNPKQIEVIYPGVNLNLYSPEKNSFSGVKKENNLTLISTGAIAERKGQHFLVDVMKDVVKQEPGARLFLVGRIGVEDPSYIVRLRQKIKDHSLQNNVVISGFMPANLMPAAYANSDIFVTGTMWEGFGMPVAEAMACGIPVVTFNTAAMHEIVSDGINGFKAPAFNTDVFANHVLRLAQNPDLRKQLGRNARVFAQQQFDGRTNTKRLVKIYQSLI